MTAAVREVMIRGMMAIRRRRRKRSERGLAMGTMASPKTCPLMIPPKRPTKIQKVRER
jgi:hypothetical protein